ncbi:MAG TPA: hypothetical protein VNB49_03400 [Candidatus Dormibacteraeota bacterium]|nr:hypothetical protein [Candidatus Dormibacteraeota bacterium]
MGSGPGKDVRVLCYEHHKEMAPKLGIEAAEPALYICREPDCLIRYDSSRGYFLDTTDKEALVEEILPRVRCALDSRPMYLAAAQTKGSFRLWKCPECGASRTRQDSSDGLEMKTGA